MIAVENFTGIIKAKTCIRKSNNNEVIMRKNILSPLILAGGMLVCASSANAESLQMPATLDYNKGLVAEFPQQGVSIKLNFRGQALYQYRNPDEGEEVNNFDIRRGRIKVTGTAADGDLKFVLQNDFTGDIDDGSEDGQRTEDLKDLYVQYRAHDMVKVRFGQFKLPFSLQWGLSSANMQHIDRSIATRYFQPGRSQGLMIHGEDDSLKYAFAVDNGESAGEGTNRAGRNTNLRLTSSVSIGNGYNRGYEGDIGHDSESNWTAGLSGSWEDARSYGGMEVDSTVLGADLGLRCSGVALQGEFFYKNTNPDLGSSKDDIGFYGQASYAIVPDQWDVAARFSAILKDDNGLDSGDIEDKLEYTVTVGRYLMGHALKVQAEAQWEEAETLGGSSTTDFVAGVQASVVL